MKIKQSFAVAANSESEAIDSPTVPKAGERYIVREVAAMPMDQTKSTWAVTVEYEVDNGF